ncbi:MAG: hypothetical protein J6X83_02125, partial [Methanomicrobium sp.]|nr:hypothetical protein [Methanomicrobium sp.]
MALTDESGLVMPVAPMYANGGGFGNNGFGGDWAWIILLLLLGWGNNGNGFGGGFGGGYGGDFPWLMTGQAGINANTNDGFRDQMLQTNITSIRDGIGNLSTQLCNCCADMSQTVNAGFSNAETAANARQIANMQTAFAGQTAMAQGFNQLGSQFADCCCENRLATERLNYTIATENCADRYEAAQNTRDILENCNRNNQAILDKLCQLELDAKNDKIADLERQLTMANLSASQIAQTGQIVDQVYNRLETCPVGTTP